jgi:DNA repair exonuclease SbcCD ATPase subunit
MKLYWIELENWRRHSKIKIDFDEDTTVIYGPNETGKSTVFEALSRGIFDKSSAQAEAIRRIKPLSASGNITSTVRIEFILNETRYRVEKNFNLRRGTSLYKIEGKKPILQSQDNSADEELIKLLEANLPSSRGSKPSQWGAFQWLWASQDYRELPTDKEGNPTTSLHLETKGGGGILVTQKFQVVQNYVQGSYAQYFTKTGKISKDSSILNMEKEIKSLKQESVEISDKIKKVDDEKQQLEEIQKQLPIFEKKLTETKEELEKARNEESDLSSILSELRASKVEVREAKRYVDDAKKGLIALEKSAEKVEEYQKKEKETRNKFSRLEALCDQLEKSQQEIKERVEEREMKIRECEELTKDARILWTKYDNMEKTEMLEKRIERIKVLDSKIESLKKKEVLITPTNKEMEKFIQNQTRIKALKESLIARGLAVAIKPGEEGSLDVKVDGEKIKDGKLITTGTECVTVSSPRLGKVTIKARLEKAHDAKVDIQHLEEYNKGILSKYCVNSIDELKELNRTQSEISNRIKELVAERKGVDERSINEITFDYKKLKEKYEEIKKIKRTHNAIKLNPVGVDLGKLVNKREKEQEVAKNVLDEARDERDKLYEELTEEKEKLARIQAEQKHISDDLENSITQERDIIHQ